MMANTLKQRIPLAREFKVNITPGLEIGPAAMIARTLFPFRSVVVAEANEECVDGKSVLDLCSLHAACGTKIKFTATGADAAPALHAVQHLFATKFQSLAEEYLGE
jgi:phosphocarrier protein